MRLLRNIVCVLSLALVSVAALAQSSPGRPIRMVVGFPPGGPIDTVARMLAPHFVEGLGQQVIVDNRAGANGIIAMDIAAKIKTVHVAYKGTAPAFSSLLSGEVQFMVSSVVSGLQHVKAGRLLVWLPVLRKAGTTCQRMPSADDSKAGWTISGESTGRSRMGGCCTIIPVRNQYC